VNRLTIAELRNPVLNMNPADNLKLIKCDMAAIATICRKKLSEGPRRVPVQIIGPRMLESFANRQMRTLEGVLGSIHFDRLPERRTCARLDYRITRKRCDDQFPESFRTEIRSFDSKGHFVIRDWFNCDR
jgi:hypothetical protein